MFESLAVARGVYECGRVDWYTAAYLFNQGLIPTDAVDRLVGRRAQCQPSTSDVQYGSSASV